MKTLIALTAAATLTLAASAFAAGPERIRGTITSATPTTLTVALANGGTQTITLASSTKYAASRASSFGAISAGEFIGTATKAEGSKNIALEVVIFPASMRGTGEGHYAWDEIPDTTVPGAKTDSSMTNGSVAAAMPARKTASSMTNGDVREEAATSGDKQLVVTYKGGEQTILVPPSAPVVQVAPAGFAALHAGDSVFVVAAPAAGGLTALYVNVGTGGTKLAM
jgi:hypothetical protein